MVGKSPEKLTKMIEKISITNENVIEEIHSSLPNTTNNKSGLLSAESYNQFVRYTPNRTYLTAGTVIKILKLNGQAAYSGILLVGRIEGDILTLPVYITASSAGNKMKYKHAYYMSDLTSGISLYSHVTSDNVMEIYLKVNFNYSIFVLKTLLSRGNVIYVEEETTLPEGAELINIE